MVKINLSAKQRIDEFELPKGVKIINIVVSRSKCKDVLLELIDADGKAKGKPLDKYLPQIKQKNIKRLRFMMNDFSTQPIEIKLSWK